SAVPRLPSAACLRCCQAAPLVGSRASSSGAIHRPAPVALGGMAGAAWAAVEILLIVLIMTITTTKRTRVYQWVCIAIAVSLSEQRSGGILAPLLVDLYRLR